MTQIRNAEHHRGLIQALEFEANGGKITKLTPGESLVVDNPKAKNLRQHEDLRTTHEELLGVDE